MAAATADIEGRRALGDRLKAALVTPIRAMRLRYLPLLMIYYAYGALGLVGVAQTFWVKEALTFTPAELAALAVWLTLPWTVKMVFGQLADSVPILGSQRRIYVFIGAAVASGMVISPAPPGAGFSRQQERALCHGGS
jgi:hypothetical protein